MVCTSSSTVADAFSSLLISKSVDRYQCPISCEKVDRSAFGVSVIVLFEGEEGAPDAAAILIETRKLRFELDQIFLG